MQLKVLYSFNSVPTVFLSRSKQSYLVKVAQIHNPSPTTEQDEFITLGAVELKSCIQLIINNSPENFHLTSEDYAVYYKDLTEQPDEPFVSSGVLSSLITSSKTTLVPGRVCQNLSASFLFGDDADSSSLTLEIRLKLHTINQAPQIHKNQQNIPEKRQIDLQQPNKQQHHQNHQLQQFNRQSFGQKKMKSSQSMASAIKATRTKSLPIFSNIPSPSMFNIMNHDKMNKPSKYDSSAVKDRFKSAPFLQSKILDNPAKRNRRNNEALSAIRTRSMTTQVPLISSPIQEEALSDSTDDADYRIDEENENTLNIDEGEVQPENADNDDEAGEDFEESSPYTPQQPPYDPTRNSNSKQNFDSTNKSSSFQSLPDFEDLDSKRTHTINHTKLPKDHGLVCVNANCATVESITWRYFETGFHPNYFEIHRAQKFDKKYYDGMFGPLCNACFLFLRNKGFMRPEGVVKKYLQQQKYKQELKKKEEANAAAIESCTSNYNKRNNENSNHSGYSNTIQYNKPNPSVRLDCDKASKSTSNEIMSLSAIAAKKSNKFASSPSVQQSHRFPTPTHTPSAINQAIQNQKSNLQSLNTNSITNNNTNNHSNNPDALSTPNFNEINDFMNQLHNYGGPLTDIDPLPQDQTLGITPPMIAEKSNTRVINVYDDGDDKENYPPDMNDFESMLVKSFATSEKSSPVFHQDWVNSLFNTEPTPTDGNFTPQDLKSNQDNESLPQLKTFINEKLTPLDHNLDMKNATVRNMPSSPVITSENNENSESYIEKVKQTSSSPGGAATRNDTTTNLLMSWGNNNESNNKQGSTPNSEFIIHEDSILDKESRKILMNSHETENT